MSPVFTVTEVSNEVRSFDSNYGPKKSYRLHLRGGDNFSDQEHLNVELVRNANSDPPKQGDTLEGDLEDRGQYGLRLKLAGRGGAGGVFSGTKEYKADPVKQRAIAMEAAQKVAVDVLRLAMDRGAWEPPAERPVAEMAGVVKVIAQSLYGQIIEVSEGQK